MDKTNKITSCILRNDQKISMLEFYYNFLFNECTETLIF